MSLAERLAAVQARVRAAVEAAGRDPATVRLLAASKTRSPETVKEAFELGQILFGENRAQSLRDKADALSGFPMEWHFIGSLQKNKAKYCVGRAVMVHSIDSFALAEVFEKRVGSLRESNSAVPPIQVLVQVNVGGEDSKGGVEPADALPLCRQLMTLEHVALRGLMTLPPFTEDPEDAAPYFEQLAALAAAGRAEGLPLEELSMGMSHDLEVAVRHGATIVRVGTAIFGPRQY